MFTGIIEETGTIKSIQRLSHGAEVEIFCEKVLEDTKLGDSICVNGTCQTVVEMSSNSFKTRLSDETLQVTTFDRCKCGDSVNLERALTLSTRLGGHIVTGHVDCIGVLCDIKSLSEFYNLSFRLPENQMKYVVYKGSVAINGISLTVAKLSDNIVTVAIIPHTFENTALKSLKIGDSVNVETDILGKYVEKFLSAKDNKEGISIEFLQGNGFI